MLLAKNNLEVITLKRLFLTAAMVLGVQALSHAAVSAPLDSRGITLPTVDLVGVKTCTITQSTGTNAVLCASGAGIVYGVSISSDAVNNFAVLRDTNTANTTSAAFATVWNQSNGTTQVTPGTVGYKFPMPIQFTNGLSVNLNASAPAQGTGVGTGGYWTILYRPRTATE